MGGSEIYTLAKQLKLQLTSYTELDVWKYNMQFFPDHAYDFLDPKTSNM